MGEDPGDAPATPTPDPWLLPPQPVAPADPGAPASAPGAPPPYPGQVPPPYPGQVPPPHPGAPGPAPAPMPGTPQAPVVPPPPGQWPGQAAPNPWGAAPQAPPAWGPPPAPGSWGGAPPPGSWPGTYGSPGYGYGAAPAGAPYAEWWQRVLALILDVVILVIPLTIVRVILAAAFRNSAGTISPGGAAVVLLVPFLLSLAYFGALDGGNNGQTVGKMALGIAVRNERTGGSIGFWWAVLRRFIYLFLWDLFFVPGLINSLSPLWDSRRKAWHDHAAHSVVVKVR